MARKSREWLVEAHALFAEFQASRPGERLSREVWVEYCGQRGRVDLAGMYDVVQPAPRAPRWRIGQKIFGDEVTIERVLGRGGMGEVFLAKNNRYLQNALPLRVALKRPIRRQQDLPRARTDEDGLAYLESFFKEVGHWVDLNEHHSIVRLLGFRCDREYDFLNLPQLAMVLEYVDGWSLDTAYGQREFPWYNGKLDTRGAIGIAINVASALEYAHGHGIAHGDVKPSNILVSKDSKRALLTDFGLARSVEAMRSRGRGYGTPGFSAPEQMRGESHDPRKADLYALGLTMLSLYSGSRQWQARPDGTVDAAALIEERRGLMGDGVTRILLRACELDPDRRATMQQLLFGLRHLARTFPDCTPQEVAAKEQYQRERPRADEPLSVLKDLFQLGKRYALLRARIEAETETGNLVGPEKIGEAAGMLLGKLDRYLKYRKSPTGVRWCLDELKDLLKRSNSLAGPGMAAILDQVIEHAEFFAQCGRSCEAKHLARVVLDCSERLKDFDVGGDIARVQSRVEQWQAGRRSDPPAASSTPIRVAKRANGPQGSARSASPDPSAVGTTWGAFGSEEQYFRFGRWMGDLHRAFVAVALSGDPARLRRIERARYAFETLHSTAWDQTEIHDPPADGCMFFEWVVDPLEWLRHPESQRPGSAVEEQAPERQAIRAALRGIREVVIRDLAWADPLIDEAADLAFIRLARVFDIRLAVKKRG